MAKHTETHINSFQPGWVDREAKRLRDAQRGPIPLASLEDRAGELQPRKRRKYVQWGTGVPGKPQDAHSRRGSAQGGKARADAQALALALGEPETEE